MVINVQIKLLINGNGLEKTRYLHCNEAPLIDKIENLKPSDKWANPKKVIINTVQSVSIRCRCSGKSTRYDLSCYLRSHPMFINL